jgi:hypothetical protein
MFLSETEVTDNAIVLVRPPNKTSEKAQRYKEKTNLATAAYRNSLDQLAAKIRSSLVLSGVDISIEEAYKQASGLENKDLVYLTTLEAQGNSLQEKLFGVSSNG